VTKRLNGTWGKVVIAVASIALTMCAMLLASGRSVGRFEERLITVVAEENKSREIVAIHDKKIAVLETQLTQIQNSVENTATVQQLILDEIRAQ
jgi:hypothetical protein